MNQKEKEVVLGIDIGGTNTKFGYVDKNGNLLAEGEMLTEAHRPAEEFFERLHTQAENLFNSKKDQLKLIGIGLGAARRQLRRLREVGAVVRYLFQQFAAQAFETAGQRFVVHVLRHQGGRGAAGAVFPHQRLARQRRRAVGAQRHYRG